MNIVPTELPDVVLLEPKVFGDARGFFMETWNEQVLQERGYAWRFVQDNHSLSTQYALRGLHYQVHRPQGKLVRVTAGEVYDVAVDLRRASPTFRRFVGVRLSAENKLMMYIPPGFAHGFLVLSERAEFLYKCTDSYFPAHERSLLWNDAELGIPWPLPEGVEPVLSPKDAAGAPLAQAETFP